MGGKQRGFTIIETLIVLAIAGLILLIVFEAVPALERSGRNNQRRQDVQAILAAVSHYELNNSGNLPACSFNGYDIDGQHDAQNCTILMPQLASQLSYYSVQNGLQVFVQHYQGTNDLRDLDNSNLNNVEDTNVQVYDYEICAPAGSHSVATIQGAGYNDVVAIYDIETGNGWATQCEQID
jgi:prepilin-type N-terminal cleavage/methylation domain-containing protein